MKKNIRLTLGCLALGSLISFPVQADFGVRGQDKPADEYGNGQTATFHNAISGTSGPLTPREQAELAALLPQRDYDRYYGRVSVNFSTLTLDQIKNRSSGVDSLGAVNIKRVSGNQIGVSLAIGYAWSRNFRADLEYFAIKNLNYNANPALTGNVPSRQLTAQVKNNTLLANFYYDFDGLYRFRPYLTAGIGLAVNSVQSTVAPAPGTTNSASQTLRTARAAYDLGLGMRVGMFSRWFLDVNYRYIRLGNGVGINPVTGYKLLTTYSMNTICVGAIYLF